MRQRLVLMALLMLSGCVSERHFARDSWPFGNPNAPRNDSETAERALGRVAVVAPIAPQAGNVWPGPVQPVPTISDEQKAMTQPLGDAYTPSLPSPYPPGTEPPPDADLGTGPLGAPGTQTFPIPDSAMPGLPGGTGAQSGTVSAPSAGAGQ